ncbi:MAG: hypothetical protein QOD77_586 [Thermoplasmata archaeon]|jgi:hypothetical protein|nr:hypothetical protein [Thermoplasmata archaeon]
MGEMLAVAKAAAAVAILSGLMWASLGGPPACPLPDGDVPDRIAALGADGVLRIHQRMEDAHVQLGARPGVAMVAPAWFGWVVAEPGRIARVDDAGFELASAASPPARAFALDQDVLWVATDGRLAAYDEHLQQLASIEVPVPRPATLLAWNHTLHVEGDGQSAAVDATEPRFPRLAADAPPRPAPGPRWAFVPADGGQAVGRVDGGRVLCRSAAVLADAGALHPTDAVVLAGAGHEVVAMRSDGPVVLFAVPSPTVALAAQ